MTSPGHLKDSEGRCSEPPSPAHTTWPKVSSLRKSATSRSRSLSPRKQPANQPLHIRMNLTETQMDKITDAFSQKVNGSPLRRSKAAALGAPAEDSGRGNSLQATSKTPGLRNIDGQGLQVMSPTFSELMPTYQDESIAERRLHIPLPPIDVSSTPKSSSKPRKARMEFVAAEVSPLSVHRQSNSKKSDRPSSSTYSMDANQLQLPRPLKLGHSRISRQKGGPHDAVVDIYQNWGDFYSSGVSPEPSPNEHSVSQHPRRSRSNVEGLRRRESPSKTGPVPDPVRRPQARLTANVGSPLFSPLALYFRGQDFPTVKKGEKVLIGDNGWLERTGQQAEQSDRDKKAPQKRAGFLDSIKKIAKDMTEIHYSGRRFADHTKASSGPQLAISLNAREQSLLYCELEYHLAAVLNNYISSELDKGHLVPDSFKKIADTWYQLGRPRVVGFRFDLETQIDLVALHVNDFTFHGRRQCNPVEIASLLQTMKVNARAIRIRTFCQPDSVIAKQLVDAQALFDLIGVPNSAQIALAEIVQFFKVIVEREQDFRQQRREDAVGLSNSPAGHHRNRCAESRQRQHL